jgi:hypothetical protein
MGRRAIMVLTAPFLLAFAASASAGHSASGIRGVLLNTTCPGPCTVCGGASTCPPCPPCTAQVCPARPAHAAIVCPAARTRAVCAGCGVEPQPYTGPDAHVVVRRVSTGDVVARRAPTDGKFSVRLGPGRYRVHGFVAASCWQGETRRITVHRSAFTTVELAVRNACVVTPQAG